MEATIRNDDFAETLMIGLPSLFKGEDGTVSLVYTSARNAGATSDIVSTLATDSTGTATAGIDLIALSVPFA